MLCRSKSHRFEDDAGPLGPYIDPPAAAVSASASSRGPGSPSALSRPASSRGGFTYAEAKASAGAYFHYYGHSDPTIRRAVTASPGGAALRLRRSGYDNGVPTPAHYYDPERDALVRHIPLHSIHHLPYDSLTSGLTLLLAYLL
jgi:hypothetical protein